MTAAVDRTIAPSGGMPAVLKMVVQTFLEDEHYKTLYQVLSERWSHCHSLKPAMNLMEAHGVVISKQEEERLQEFEESRMIDILVAKMPQDSREKFEHFFLQLSFIASTTRRVRDALQSGDTATVADAMESAENIGVLAHMLKTIVAQAGTGVKRFERERDQWLGDTTEKMGPLLQKQANRMEVQKQLAQMRAQMGHYHSSAKDKGKNMLLKMADGNDRNLLENIMAEWHQITRQEKLETEIVKEYNYEEQLTTATKKLVDFRSKHLAGARQMMEKNWQAMQAGSLSAVFQAFKDNCEESKRRKEGGESLRQHEERLKAFNNNARANAQKAMANMNNGNDSFLTELCFNEWVAYLLDYKKDKEVNDAVKKSEQKMAEMMKKQNQGAMDVVKKMGAAAESGLIASVFQGWYETIADAKQEREVEEQLNQKSAQLAGLAGRGKDNANNTSARMSELQDLQLTLFAFCFWKREVQVERVRRYGRDKNNKRKQELQGVKGLFKDFAGKLDNTLKAGTPRLDDKQLSPKAVRGARESPTQPRSPQPQLSPQAGQAVGEPK